MPPLSVPQFHRSNRRWLCSIPIVELTLSALERERERERESAMITRSNLAEQLREYQIRSKHDWASVSFFSSTTNLPSSRYLFFFLFFFFFFCVTFLQFLHSYVVFLAHIWDLLAKKSGIELIVPF